MIVARTTLAASLLCMALGSVVMVAALRNGRATLPPAHTDLERVEVARQVAEAVRWADAHRRGTAADVPCEALASAAEQWQRALVGVRARLGLTAPIVIDPALLLRGSGLGCEAQAHRLNTKLRDALPMFAAADRWADGAGRGSAASMGEAVARIESADARTWNPYALLPLQLSAGDGGRVALGRDLAGERWLPSPAHPSIAEVVHDQALAARIAEVLSTAHFRPVRQAPLGEREVPAAARLALTLDEDLQRASAAWVRCFTGRLADCRIEHALPASLLADPRLRLDASAPRAPAAALVVVDVSSGRFMALAGAVGECAARMLQRDATPASGTILAFGKDGDRCAQFPDRRHRYLLDEHAALWVVPPGSFAKMPVTAACLSARRHSAAELAELRSQLALSDDNEYFKRRGLACAGAFQRAWLGVVEPSSITLGTAPWMAARASPGGFDATDLLDPAAYEAVARRLRSSPRAKRELGPEATARYLRSAAVASLAIGGGGMGMNTLAIVQLVRDLALRAQGAAQAPAMHLIRDADAPLPARSLAHFDAAAAAATLEALGAVTSSSAGGTAHGACARVMGRCPPGGLADVAGKTGTADFTVSEASNRVKDDATKVPAKVFGAVFEAGGRRYAAAAMVLRGRDLDGRLELHGNAAAELVLLARRRLRDRAGDDRPDSEQAASALRQPAVSDNNLRTR